MSQHLNVVSCLTAPQQIAKWNRSFTLSMYSILPQKVKLTIIIFNYLTTDAVPQFTYHTKRFAITPTRRALQPTTDRAL